MLVLLLAAGVLWLAVLMRKIWRVPADDGIGWGLRKGSKTRWSR